MQVNMVYLHFCEVFINAAYTILYRNCTARLINQQIYKTETVCDIQTF
jgi:hypothetical protein